MSTKVFKERSNVIATVDFRSEGAAYPPTTVHYKLQNVTAGTTPIDWTSTTAADSIEISLPASKLVVSDRSNKKELFELTVSGNKGLDTEVPNNERFYIIRLAAYD